MNKLPRNILVVASDAVLNDALLKAAERHNATVVRHDFEPFGVLCNNFSLPGYTERYENAQQMKRIAKSLSRDRLPLLSGKIKERT
jgi:hypothetical protein